VISTPDIARLEALARQDLRDLIASYAPSNEIRRIAVVGNAPLEPSVSRVAAIESADLVIRCNSFALDAPDAAAYSGRSTHVVVLNGGTRVNPWTFRGYTHRLYLRSQPGAVYRRKPTRPLPKIDLWPDDLGALCIPNGAVLAPLREHLIRLAPAVDDEDVVVPTSGTIAAWLGYLLFPEATLSLTGFSFLTEPEQTEWVHHWDGGTGADTVSTAHKIDREAVLIRQWIAEGRAEHLPETSDQPQAAEQ
jgi:hypothetical protein